MIDDIVSNVDFAPTWLELAGLAKPPHMQGESFLPVLQGRSQPQSPDAVAYHRYWMHRERTENCYVSAIPACTPNRLVKAKSELPKLSGKERELMQSIRLTMAFGIAGGS